jgi:hypothetical protein
MCSVCPHVSQVRSKLGGGCGGGEHVVQDLSKTSARRLAELTHTYFVSGRVAEVRGRGGWVWCHVRFSFLFFYRCSEMK